MRDDRNTWLAILAMTVFGIGIWVAASGKDVSLWDSMFVELRVQEPPK